MPVRQRAGARVGREVRLEPPNLSRAGAARDHVAAVARVEDDHMPVAQVVAVVALAGVTRGGAEVAEVAGRAGVVVLAVPCRWPRACPGAAPRRLIAVGELGG